MARVMLSVIVVNYNTKELLANCVNSVLTKIKKINFELILVDNASTDGSVAYIKSLLKKRSKVKAIFNSKNLGFSKASNQGMQIASGEYILLLNSDTIIPRQSDFTFLAKKNEKIGIATVKIVGSDGKAQLIGGYFPTVWRVFLWALFLDDIPAIAKIWGAYHYKFFPYNKPMPLDWVSGTFFLIRRKVVDEVGFLDEDYFMYVEDVDYCFRAKKAGWQVWYLPEFSIVHLGSASGSGQVIKFRNGVGKEGSIVGEFKGLKIFYQKHYPYFLPVLSVLLKLGALLRMVGFGVTGQTFALKAYAKAFSV